MTLRSDLEWLSDATDQLVHGGLPTWPRQWTTVTCGKIAEDIKALHERYFHASMAHIGLRARIAALEVQVDGERAQNAVMTEQIERLERRTA